MNVTTATANGEAPKYDVVIIGAGVAGIYQLYRLLQLGLSVTVLDTASDLGGTWYWNRYPGCRFDSESYSYGYSFSRELLNEWHWKELFSGQPENLRYLNYVADKFGLRKYMQFNARVESAHFDDENNIWRLRIADGRDLACRFLFTCLGLLSAPTLPRYPGLSEFKGQSFHTYNWPKEEVELAGKNVAVIGTGATGVQVISEIADKVRHLTVFQRRPNWCAPLNNAPISETEMADIRARYDEIFATCARTPGGFVHDLDRRRFHEVPLEERRKLWDRLYDGPGFGILFGNFREIFTDETANAELCEYIADRIRKRVKDPALAEKLIPKDHGFGMQRVPLETRYYEAYNRDNVRLVDLQETPIERITPTGLRTTGQDHDFDVIVYATGFDAMTGSFDRIDIRGVGDQKLRDKWAHGPRTFLGMQVNGFPNMIAIAGPQSGSASINFPRGIEIGVEWATRLLEYVLKHGYARMEATREAEERWTTHVAELYNAVLMRKSKGGWFNGYNSNVDGHEYGTVRHYVYNGSGPKYVKRITEVADSNYGGITFS